MRCVSEVVSVGYRIDFFYLLDLRCVPYNTPGIKYTTEKMLTRDTLRATSKNVMNSIISQIYLDTPTP